MTMPSEPTRLVLWLRRQRRLTWRAILLCALFRIGDAALVPDAASAITRQTPDQGASRGL